MSKNYYSEVNLHLTWHTKDSQPLITSAIEPLVQRLLRQKANELGGIYIHEIGGIETHIHLAVSIEPTVTISDLVGALKVHILRGQSPVWSQRESAPVADRLWRGQLRHEGSAVGEGVHSQSKGTSFPRDGSGAAGANRVRRDTAVGG